MGSKAVRDAMVKASVGNVRTFVWLDEGREGAGIRTGGVWTSVPIADVKNVLDELARLQDVENRLEGLIDAKKREELDALERGRLAYESDSFEFGSVWENEAKAREVRSLRGTLEGVLNG